MYSPVSFRKSVCILLAVCMMAIFLLPVCASETPGETEASAAETTSPAETTSVTEETFQEEEAYALSCDYTLYFGLLHAHTDLSDGIGTVEEAFSHAAAVEGLDFFAVTDHSNSFDNAQSGALSQDGSDISTKWAAGKAAAAAVTDEDFLGLFGFEMTWPEIRQLGHITTFGTPGWVSRDQEGFSEDADALEHYFDALAAVPESVSQFCHPGSLFGDFDRFSHYRPEYDDSMHLLETLGQGSISRYIQALDAGWHLAPTASQNNHNGNWGSENDLRTVILAESLTEKHIFEAIQARRVYATEDRDLQICYELDGQIMGGVLSTTDDPEVFLSLFDPSDAGSSTIEVIGPKGVLLKTQTLEGNGDLVFSVPDGHRWYFLKITQADGETAVTAPVWVEGFENMGTSSLTADADVPVVNRPLTLKLDIYNEEPVDFSLTSLELYAEDTPVYNAENPGTVPAEDALCLDIPYTHSQAGTVSLRAVIRGTVLGKARSYEETLRLRFRPQETVAQLLIDGSHGNSESLTRVQALAAEAGIETTVFTGLMPMGGSFLLIPPMQTPPDEDFIRDIAAFLEEGNTLILSGCPDGNALLEALGSTLRFGTDSVPKGSATTFHPEAPWCESLSPSQYFLHDGGTSVESGSGQWLVKDSAGNILLAREQLGSGNVFAGGSFFLTDEMLPPAQSLWQMPSANQSIFQSILGFSRPVPEKTDISQVRSLPDGTLCRIKGYVTAGTSDPNTTFPNTVYLQDDTGGIEISGFDIPDIQIGSPLEVIGVPELKNGVPSLRYTDHQIPREDYYYFTPDTIGCKTATDYSLRGGQLVQVEGTVTALTKTEDGKGIRRITLKDIRGNSAVIEIEDAIRSGSTGENTLAKTVKKGRTLCVLGLVHINDAGETVIRVRDCDEVVYIPPKADPSNPKTVDPLWWLP